MRAKRIVWITTWALSKGIVEMESDSDVHCSMIEAHRKGVLPQHFVPPDWHDTREDAVEQARKMKKERIASLGRSLARMKALKF